MKKFNNANNTNTNTSNTNNNNKSTRLRHLADVRSEAETFLRWQIIERELKPMGLSWHDMTPAHHARIAQAGERAVERVRSRQKGLEGWLTIG